MTTIQEAYIALADGPLSSVGLRAFPYVPDESEWPAAYLLPPTVTYEGLGYSFIEARVEVIVLVSAAIDKNQVKLIPFQDIAGESSILEAIQDDPTLGQDGLHVTVTKTRPLHITEQSDYRAFGAMIELTMRLG